MPTDVIMPQMGESIFEGTITKWLKQPGEKVQRDEPLFEISTDKVDAEIPAPASGTLQDIKVQAGATVQVNTVVGTIAAEGEAAGAAAPAPAQPAKPAAAGDGSKAAPSEAAKPAVEEAPKAASRQIPADLAQRREGRPGTAAAGQGSGVSRSRRAGARSLQPAGPPHCQREQCRPDQGSGHRPGRPHYQGRHRGIHRQAWRRSTRSGGARVRSGASLRRPAAPAAAGRDRSAAARRRRHAWRSRAHVGHAQEDRRAHGDVEAHQRARAWHLRGRRHPHREAARAHEGASSSRPPATSSPSRRSSRAP